MNSDQLYEKNLTYIKQINPMLYQKIIDADISNMKIHIYDGNINIEENGQLIYPKNSTEFVAKKLESFFQKPTAIYKSPTISELGEFSKVNDQFCMKIEEKKPSQKTSVEEYSEHLDSIPMLLMLGVGTGQQIEYIINTIDVKTMIVTDKSFAHLKLSISIIDWKPIFEYFSRPGYKINFIISSSAKTAAYESINAIFSEYKYLMYYVNFYSTYHNDFIKEIIYHIKDKYKIAVSGWGFYDDEKTSLLHSIENLNTKNNIYNLKKPLNKDSSVFIVASGPSIDNDIEFLKKNRKEIIIFSCGSALKILEANDIIPDYHFEIERNVVTYNHLVESMSKEYLSQINFIGLNVVYPDVYNLFKTTKIFFRSNDCGASILSNSFTQLEHTNPTVTNGVVSFASSIGFKNIYLFGADMGYKDENSHHSKHSIYTMEKASYFYNWKPNTLDKTYKANFNSDTVSIKSTDILVWCRQRIENCIIEYNINDKQKIQYFNCSDGAFIEGTTPIKSSEIDLSNLSEESKNNTIKMIEQNFSKHDKKVHKTLQLNLKNNKNELENIIKFICKTIDKNKTITSFGQFFDIANAIFLQLKQSRQNINSSMTSTLLNGTLSHMFSTTYTHALMSKDFDEALKYIEHGLKVVKEFVLFVKKDIKDLTIK